MGTKEGDLQEFEGGFTRYTKWACPNTDEHPMFATTESFESSEKASAAPAPVAPTCADCGATMIDAAVFTDHTKTPPLPAPHGWVWNEARGPYGYWERFNPVESAIVPLASIGVLREAMRAHVDASDYGKPLLEAAARIIERLAHPMRGISCSDGRQSIEVRALTPSESRRASADPGYAPGELFGMDSARR